jgi:argininosuccinate lyase
VAHLLVIESWVGGTGRILPPAIGRLGHRYTFVTRNRAHYLDGQDGAIHPVIEHADNVLTAETNDTQALSGFLRAQHELLRFDGVLTVCDYYVDTVAAVAQSLGLPQSFPAQVARIRRKHLVREALQQAGLPNPRFAVTRSWDEAREAAGRIGYPLVLKPSDLASSAFVRRVGDEAQLRDAFDALRAFPMNFRAQPREPLWLLEAYMSGEEVSVEACTFRGETTLIGITDKSLAGDPFFIEDGHMFPAPLPPATAAAVQDLVRGALEAVGFDHGISHTEVKLTAQGPRIVEINPRPGGNYIAELVQRVTGIDLLAAQIDLSLGRRPELRPQETGVASAAVKFLVPPHGGRLLAMRGREAVQDAPHVARCSLEDATGRLIAAPVDNACYLGHVVAVDPHGTAARRHAEQAMDRVVLTFDDGNAGTAAPLRYDTVADLTALVLAGRCGPDPAQLTVAGSFWVRQATRFPGTEQRYSNHYLLLRVEAAFGACCVERDQLDPPVADELAGRSVASLLADARLPVRIAALDAYFAAAHPHPLAAEAVPFTLPRGTPLQRAQARDAAIAGLLRLQAGQKVALIGVVDPLVKAIRQQGATCLPCDFNKRTTDGGLAVVQDMQPLLAQADAIIATGMTLANGSFDAIVAAARRRGIPLAVYAQTGSAVVPRFLGHGVHAVSAEPFPFSQFTAEPSAVYLYRQAGGG